MNQKILFSALICGTILLSCQKNDSVETSLTPSNLNLVAEDALTTQYIDHMMSYVDFYSAIDEASLLKSATIDMGCVIVTRTSKQGIPFPVTLTLDFGTGCTGLDGKLKTGKITIVKSACWKDAGATRTVTFDNLTIDGVKMAGTQTATNEGVKNGKQTFTWTGNITLTKADNTSVTRNETRTREFIAGFDTPAIQTDDVIQISGSSTVTKSDKTTYSRVILVPLVRKGDCDFITAGTVEISRSGAEKFTLDYGTGACDNKATVTRGTTKKEIVLKK